MGDGARTKVRRSASGRRPSRKLHGIGRAVDWLMMRPMISSATRWTMPRTMLVVTVAVVLICELYWSRLPNVGAAGIIISFVLLIKAVVASGWISISKLFGSHSIAADLSPRRELAKAAGFFVLGVTVGAIVATGMRYSVIPDNLATAIVFLTTVLVTAMGSGAC